MQEMWVPSLGWEDPLEEKMSTHSSILAWEIPWTESLGGYSAWGHKTVGRDLATKHQQQRVQCTDHMDEKLEGLY